MTQRERHTPGGRAPRPAAGPPAPARGRPARPEAAGHRRPACASLWEEWYQRASPAQQREALALAARQGLLYGHQLPPPANGFSPAHSTLLAALLNGQTEGLEPVRPASLEPIDPSLD